MAAKRITSKDVENVLFKHVTGTIKLGDITRYYVVENFDTIIAKYVTSTRSTEEVIDILKEREKPLTRDTRGNLRSYDFKIIQVNDKKAKVVYGKHRDRKDLKVFSQLLSKQ